MPAQGNPTRIKTALDTEVCNKVIELERDFYRYVDVAMQPHATPLGQFIRRNRKRKKGQSKWPK